MPNTLELKKKLWQAASKLFNNIDIAEYKYLILGLIFLKYISDAFDELYQKLEASKQETGFDPEDKKGYITESIFYMSPLARWKWLQGRSKLPTIGEDIDKAIGNIEIDNPSLKGVLPKGYASSALDSQRLGELVELIGSISLNNCKNKDIFVLVFEYFLEQFAEAEGKKGGQFYTPYNIVKILVDMLAPEPEKQVYDGCCGTGGMLVQSKRFIEMQEEPKGKISIFGQENHSNTFKLAKMNLAIHGMDAQIEPGDTFMNDKFPELKADYVIACPPFNMSNYNINKAETHKWKYGIPPLKNANYAWLQHFLSKLAPYGTAGVVLANRSMSSEIASEIEIRKAMIEYDLIDCMVSLPSQLFYNTQLPVCIWILTTNKIGTNKFRNRTNEILFIDAQELGIMINRKQKKLDNENIAKISDTYHKWKSKEGFAGYKDMTGFCKSANIQDIRKNNYILTPGKYIDFKKLEEDEFDLKMQYLTATLYKQIEKSFELDKKIKNSLKKIGYKL